MSTSIDRRIVELAMENGQFERGAQTSIKTLDNLNKSLRLDNATSGLSELSRASRGFNLNPISDALSSVSGGFSALAVIGITALANITNSVVNLGRQMVQRLTIQPLQMGLREYETQINAIQTVLANTESKGTTLQDVNEALNELNRYADKTIYNFSEMTRNIGTFTAAGISLETSTAAIKGIANLAAVSGSNAQQASTAMYQLSQAMASGTVRLMDWNSVVNAGMGGQVFQDALKETARVHGIKIDEMIKKEGSFRETLQNGWLSTEILTETLSKFTGDLTADQLKTMGYTEEQIAGILKLGVTASDAATKIKTFSQLTQTIQESIQSGWAQSWQIVVGDFVEAKALFTEVGDLLNSLAVSTADSRNALLSSWKALGGREELLGALRASITALGSAVKPVMDAMKEIFPPITAINLVLMTRALKEFIIRLNLSGPAADKVKSIFKGVASIFDILKMAVVALVKAILPLGTTLGSLVGKVVDFLAKIGDYITNLRESIILNDTFTKAIKSFIGYIGFGIVKVKEFGSKILSIFEKAKKSISGISVAEASTKIKSFGQLVLTIFESLKSGWGAFSSTVGGIIAGFVKRVKARFGSLSNIGEGLKDVFGNLFGGIGAGLEKSMKSFGSKIEKVKTFISMIGKKIWEAFTKIDFSKFDFNSTFDTINSGLLAGLLLAVTNFVKKGGGMFDGVKDIFSSIKGVADSVSKVAGTFSGVLEEVRTSLKTWQETLRADMLMKIAIAIAILAASLIALSLVDSAKLTQSLTAITVLFADLFGSLIAFEKVSGTGDIPAMSKAIGAMNGLAVAVLIFSIALVALSKIEPEKLKGAVGAITAITVELVASAVILSKYAGSMNEGALGLVLMAAAILILAKGVEILGEMNPDVVVQGLVSLGAILAEVSIFAKTMGKTIITSGSMFALIGLAIAIAVLAKSVNIFGNMDQAKLLQGMAAVGILLSEIAVFARATGNSKLIIQTAASMVIFGAAMLIMAEAVGKMGKMSWEEIGRGMTVLAGAMLILVLSLRLLPKDILLISAGLLLAAGSMFVMSQALKSLGELSWEEITRGLLALGVTMGILALGLYAMSSNLAGAAAMALVSVALIALATALQMLGSLSLAQIGIAMLALAGMFVVFGVAALVLAPILPILLGLTGVLVLFGLACLSVGAGVLLLSMGLAALAVTGAAGVTAFGAVILAFVLAVMNAIPLVAQAFVQMIVSILQTFATNIPLIVQAGIDMLMGLLTGIRDNIQEVVITAVEIIAEFLRGLAESLPSVIEAGFDLLVAFLDGIADGLEDHMQEITDSGIRIAEALAQGVIDGLGKVVLNVVTAARNLGEEVIKAIKGILGIKSPSKVTFRLGEYSGIGLADGLVSTVGLIGKAGERAGSKAVDSLSKTISSIPDSINTNIDINPIIRPVLDMSNVEAGAKTLDKAFSSRTIQLSSNLAILASQRVNDNAYSGTQETQQTGQTITFTQNNYSPEALDPIEVYRQTRNQLETLKGVP